MTLFLIGFIVLDVFALLLGILAISHSGRTKRAYLDSFFSGILAGLALLAALYGLFAKTQLLTFENLMILVIGTLAVAAVNLIALIISAIRKGFRTPDPEDAPPPPPPAKDSKNKD